MNKGFTLVELLAVLAIMSLVIIITAPAYNGISNTIKENSYNSKISMMEKSTKTFVNKYHKDKVYAGGDDGNKTLCLSIPYLISKNVFAEDEKDPDTGIGKVTNPKGGSFEGYLKATYNLNEKEILIEYIEYKEDKKFENLTNTDCSGGKL